MNDREVGKKTASVVINSPGTDPILTAEDIRDRAKFYKKRADNAKALYTPLTTEMIKGAAAAIAAENIQFNKSPYKFGIPTTRDEFARFYLIKILKGNLDLEKAIGESEWVKDKELLTMATMKSEEYIRYLPQLAKRLEEYSIDSAPLVAKASSEHLGPADIDLTKLDPGLSINEKNFITARVLIARKLLETPLMSNVDQAPTNSDWGNRVKAAEAIEKFMKRQ